MSIIDIIALIALASTTIYLVAFIISRLIVRSINARNEQDPLKEYRVYRQRKQDTVL